MFFLEQFTARTNKFVFLSINLKISKSLVWDNKLHVSINKLLTIVLAFSSLPSCQTRMYNQTFIKHT